MKTGTRRTATLVIGAAFLLAGAGPAAATSHGLTQPRAAGPAASTDVLLDTIIVPVNGASVTSVTTLAFGVRYKLVASGVFFVGGPGYGDAEYAFNSSQTHIINHCGGTPSGVDLGIAIDDPTPAAHKFPFWGRYTPTHVYKIEGRGRGKPISLNYHDCNYADNVGSLTVRIFGPAVP